MYKGMEIIEGHLSRDHARYSKYTTQNKYIEFYGVFKREKCVNDV